MKKLTTMIVSILCLVMIVSGCGNAPANAGETQSENSTQQTDSTTSTETSEAVDESESTSQTETSATNPVTIHKDTGISRWSIKSKDEGGTRVAYLEHGYGPDWDNDVEEVYVFGPESGIEADQCTIMDKNKTEDLFLLHQHRNFYTFDLNTNELKCIVDTYLDYYYESGNLFYLDLDHNEYVIKWKKTDTPKATGESFVALFKGSFYPSEMFDFTDRFLEIQEAIASGANPDEITDVKIMDNGDMYDLNGEYASNIHMEYPVYWEPNVFFDCNGIVIKLMGTYLDFYRYGDIVQSYELPMGNFRVIQALVTYNVSAEELYSRNPLADEVKSAITDTRILLYNIEDKSVWRVDSSGTNKVCSEVVDYQEFNGVLYWMNTDFIPYTLNWLETDESKEIGSEVVAVAHYADEHAGFVVRPEDSRANAEVDGLSIYIP